MFEALWSRMNYRIPFQDEVIATGVCQQVILEESGVFILCSVEILVYTQPNCWWEEKKEQLDVVPTGSFFLSTRTAKLCLLHQLGLSSGQNDSDYVLFSISQRVVLLFEMNREIIVLGSHPFFNSQRAITL